MDRLLPQKPPRPTHQPEQIMKWSNKLPKEAGYFWQRHPHCNDEVIKVFKYGDQFISYRPGVDCYLNCWLEFDDSILGYEFAGPIPEPEN